ncbi:hypothetical protein ES705_30338 [subsurface metagenome]
MACHISVRDIDFHPSETGVRIRVTTDVPSHLFLRLSSQTPRIHMKPSIRRGVAFAEDVRFCFTVFVDNEQDEVGDTVEHTWWEKNWPVCTTKWLYVWGSRLGEVCVSTTAPFHYHNDGVSPVTPPRVLKTFTTVEPNLISYGTTNDWRKIDLSGLVDENASGVLLHWRRMHGGTETSLGVRKPGATGQHLGISRVGQQGWFIAGLDDAKQFEHRTYEPNSCEFWLMGYFNKNVHFFDDCIERIPYPLGFTTIDWSDLLPADAIAGIFLVGSPNVDQAKYGVRPFGSTRSTIWGSCTHHLIVKLNDLKVDYGKDRAATEYRFRNVLVGYITAGYTGETEGLPLPVGADSTWQDILCTPHYPDPQLAIFEWVSTAVFDVMGARKWESNHTYVQQAYGHVWPMIHPHLNGRCQLYRPNVNCEFWLMGSLD